MKSELPGNGHGWTWEQLEARRKYLENDAAEPSFIDGSTV